MVTTGHRGAPPPLPSPLLPSPRLLALPFEEALSWLVSSSSNPVESLESHRERKKERNRGEERVTEWGREAPGHSLLTFSLSLAVCSGRPSYNQMAFSDNGERAGSREAAGLLQGDSADASGLDAGVRHTQAWTHKHSQITACWEGVYTNTYGHRLHPDVRRAQSFFPFLCSFVMFCNIVVMGYIRIHCLS